MPAKSSSDGWWNDHRGRRFDNVSMSSEQFFSFLIFLYTITEFCCVEEVDIKSISPTQCNQNVFKNLTKRFFDLKFG